MKDPMIKRCIAVYVYIVKIILLCKNNQEQFVYTHIHRAGRIPFDKCFISYSQRDWIADNACRYPRQWGQGRLVRWLLCKCIKEQNESILDQPEWYSTHHCTIFQRGAACARSSPMSLLWALCFCNKSWTHQSDIRCLNRTKKHFQSLNFVPNWLEVLVASSKNIGSLKQSAAIIKPKYR